MHAQCYEWSQPLLGHYLQNVGQERLNSPSRLIWSPSTLHPFRASCLTFYVQSIFCDISVAGNTDPWIYNLPQHWLQQQMVASPVHSKTLCKVSPGTHVAARAFTGLEDPPTTCGVPLSSLAKSSPLSVLVKLQKSLHRGNSTPAEFLLRTRKTPRRYQAHHFKERIFVAFTAQSEDYTFLNLRTQNWQYTVLNLHHETQPLQYTSAQISPLLHLTQVEPLPARAPCGVFTPLKWHLACHPSTSLSKDPQSPLPGVAGPPLCPRVAKAKQPSFPLLLLELFTQVDQVHLSM